jgi:hypothetical protein
MRFKIQKPIKVTSMSQIRVKISDFAMFELDIERGDENPFSKGIRLNS